MCFHMASYLFCELPSGPLILTLGAFIWLTLWVLSYSELPWMPLYRSLSLVLSCSELTWELCWPWMLSCGKLLWVCHFYMVGCFECHKCTALVGILWLISLGKFMWQVALGVSLLWMLSYWLVSLCGLYIGLLCCHHMASCLCFHHKQIALGALL